MESSVNKVKNHAPHAPNTKLQETFEEPMQVHYGVACQQSKESCSTCSKHQAAKTRKLAVILSALTLGGDIINDEDGNTYLMYSVRVTNSFNTSSDVLLVQPLVPVCKIINSGFNLMIDG